jgi:hypothetical protein
MKMSPVLYLDGVNSVTYKCQDAIAAQGGSHVQNERFTNGLSPGLKSILAL